MARRRRTRRRSAGPIKVPREGLITGFLARVKELGHTVFCRPCFAYVSPEHQHAVTPKPERDHVIVNRLLF